MGVRAVHGCMQYMGKNGIDIEMFHLNAINSIIHVWTLVASFRNLFPENLIQACLQNAKTEIRHEFVSEESVSVMALRSNLSLLTNSSSVTVVKHKLVYKNGANLMGTSLWPPNTHYTYDCTDPDSPPHSSHDMCRFGTYKLLYRTRC